MAPTTQQNPNRWTRTKNNKETEILNLDNHKTTNTAPVCCSEPATLLDLRKSDFIRDWDERNCAICVRVLEMPRKPCSFNPFCDLTATMSGRDLCGIRVIC